MKKAILLVALLLAGCNNIRKLTEGEDVQNSAGRPWVPITGTWSGFYSTDAFPQGESCTMWVNFMTVYNDAFDGVMNCGHRGGLDGVGMSSFTGRVNPAERTFSMRVFSPDTFDPQYCVNHPLNPDCIGGVNPTLAPSCPGEFEVSGQVLVGPHGTDGLTFTGISGSNCLGAHTTISGTF